MRIWTKYGVPTQVARAGSPSTFKAAMPQDLMGNAGEKILFDILNAPRNTVPCDGLDKKMSSADWKKLEVDGFTVIKGFCTAEEVATMKATYDNTQGNANKNYAAKNAEFPSSVMQRFHELLPYIREKAHIEVDQVWPAQAYATKQSGQDNRFDWHVDQGTYSICGTHASMLNLYLAVYKTVPEKSNLSVIPWPAFEKAVPSIAKRIADKGSFCWLPGEKGNPERPDPEKLYMHDQRSMSHAEDCPDPNSIGYTPHLNAGDLLILKQDLPHKTQDNETARIAFTAKAVGTRYMEEVAWGSVDNLIERFGFYPGRFLYLLNMVGGDPIKVSTLHAELAVIALTYFLSRPVPSLLKKPFGLTLRYTIMPLVVFLLATKMLLQWPTVWLLRGVRDRLHPARGHWMPLTAFVPCLVIVIAHWFVVTVPVALYYGAFYGAARLGGLL